MNTDRFGSGRRAGKHYRSLNATAGLRGDTDGVRRNGSQFKDYRVADHAFSEVVQTNLQRVESDRLVARICAARRDLGRARRVLRDGLAAIANAPSRTQLMRELRRPDGPR